METNHTDVAAADPEAEKKLVDRCLRLVLDGGTTEEADVYALAEITTSEGVKALRDAAAEITRRFSSRRFDSCSIVNARSGRCPEDCKWCAQSARYNTHCETYDVIDRQTCLDAARLNSRCGIGRFSFVTGGRALKGRALDAVCRLAKEVKAETGLFTCASLGLLNREELMQLWDAGVRRYHCNLETAPSHFVTLCSTHSIEDKIATIGTAREIGFEICSGGIIGMGETRRQRAEFALTLRRVQPDSIPVNILSPIKGTPLADIPLISTGEIIDTVALMRMAHPRTVLRFAGGRARLSRAEMLEAIRVGINGGIMGDLLTTVGATVADDIDMIRDAGYSFSGNDNDSGAE